MKIQKRIGTDGGPLLRFLVGLFTFNIEISKTPLGPKLGELPLPGNPGTFINLDSRVIGLVLVYGHIALV